mmetsp:Transcript_1608/g.3504  ORF Transcript_1608/g.3504 Transcript_1608/m.3504 type:complete len:210 (-) Transcript_1608:14-643(-)
MSSAVRELRAPGGSSRPSDRQREQHGRWPLLSVLGSGCSQGLRLTPTASEGNPRTGPVLLAKSPWAPVPPSSLGPGRPSRAPLPAACPPSGSAPRSAGLGLAWPAPAARSSRLVMTPGGASGPSAPAARPKLPRACAVHDAVHPQPQLSSPGMLSAPSGESESEKPPLLSGWRAHWKASSPGHVSGRTIPPQTTGAIRSWRPARGSTWR